jgi:hypothetical protein
MSLASSRLPMRPVPKTTRYANMVAVLADEKKQERRKLSAIMLWPKMAYRRIWRFWWGRGRVWGE